jgi:hypothetical protein
MANLFFFGYFIGGCFEPLAGGACLAVNLDTCFRMLAPIRVECL